MATQEDLKTAFDWAMGQTQQGVVFMENDLRAHANPTRMNAIRQAATVLAQQMTSLCPACGSVGFWVRDREAGSAVSLLWPTHFLACGQAMDLQTVWSPPGSSNGGLCLGRSTHMQRLQPLSLLPGDQGMSRASRNPVAVPRLPSEALPR